MLEGATKVLIDQFFQRLTAAMAGGDERSNQAGLSWWQRVLKALGF
jgi:hypothetical protein